MLTPGVGCISPNMYSFSRSLGRDVAGPQASISGSRPHNEKPSQRAEICTMIHVFGGVWWRRRRLVPAPAVRSPELVRPPIPFPRRLRPLRTSTAPVRPPQNPNRGQPQSDLSFTVLKSCPLHRYPQICTFSSKPNTTPVQ